MLRAQIALFAVALLVALAWPLSQAIGAAAGPHEPALCRHMTPERMLENPALAEEWAAALRSAQPDEVARVRALIDEIRAAHGCTGGGAVQAPGHEPRVLPPGHPPVGGQGDLPQGHAQVPSSPPIPPTPIFHAPAVLDI